MSLGIKIKNSYCKDNIQTLINIYLSLYVMEKENKNNIRPIILIFGIIALFIFVVSFVTFYTTENFSSACGCQLPPWIIIVSVSSLGLFVGLVTYYLISKNFLKEKKEIEENLFKFLDLLEKEDRDVLKIIIKNNGKIGQSSLAKTLDVDKVKMSRIISRMEDKKMLKKEKHGMTNKIVLKEELRELFLE